MLPRKTFGDILRRKIWQVCTNKTITISLVHTETTNKSKPVAQNGQNTKLVNDEPSTSKGSSSTQVSSMTKESTATKGSYATQESIARQREDKYSSSTFEKKGKVLFTFL